MRTITIEWQKERHGLPHTRALYTDGTGHVHKAHLSERLTLSVVQRLVHKLESKSKVQLTNHVLVVKEI